MDNTQYELREALSEIRRHHQLITDLKEALEWSLPLAESFAKSGRLGNELKKHDQYRKLLNRQVS